MPATGKEAVARAERESRRPSAPGPRYWRGLCLKFVRIMFGIPGGTPDAATAWKRAQHKHSDAKPPFGVPVFWTGGSQGYGHVAISLGDGTCWSNDFRRVGKIDRVKIADITRVWKLRYVGWSEDLNGVRVYTPPGAAPKPVAPAPKVEDEWVVVDEANRVLVRGKAGWSLNQGINAGGFKPAIGKEYRILSRKA